MSEPVESSDGQPGLQDLPYPALNAVFADIDIEGTTSTSTVDKALCDVASLYVVESNAAGPPAKVWQRFQRADGLRLTLKPTAAAMLESLFRSCHAA